MQPLDIRTIADIHRIEAEPCERFMPFRNLHEALAASATRTPDHHALSFVVDDDLDRAPQRWSYREFLTEVQRAGRLFQRLAGNAQPRVALLLPAIADAHFALWGAECVGVACPLNYLLSAEHLVHLVRSAQCNILVALADGQGLALAEKVQALREGCPELRQVLMVGAGPSDAAVDFATARSAEATGEPPGASQRAPDEVVALFHTGGTTGQPKLAQHTHRNQLHSARGAAAMYAMSQDDRIVNGLPMFHVAGSLVFGLSTLMAGGTIILPTLLGMRHAGYMGRYWAFAAREQATLVTATPTGIATLMTAPRENCDLRVRALLTGGAPLPTGLADAFEREFSIPVRNTLGMTECAGVISIEPFLAPRVAGSCGLRLPFVEVRLEDAKGQRSSSGVLKVRGPNVGPGYTEAERNVGSFDGGWLVSGDLARIDTQERLYVTGRAKDLIIRNSHNIDPLLIEEALVHHPGISMVAAVGEPDEYAGEIPVAYVVAKPGAVLAAEDLLAFLTPRIAERPALPKRVEVLDSLPQTGVGKVYKPALRLLAIEHALRQKLRSAGIDGVEVRGEETPTGLGACFIAAANAPCSVPLEPALQALMQRFSLPWRLERRP